MAQLTIQVNGRPYLVGCEDGQENHLRELAKLFDAHVRQLTGEIGQLGETRRELFNLRFQLATGQLDNSSRLAAVRKDIARLSTFVREREIAAAEALSEGEQS